MFIHFPRRGIAVIDNGHSLLPPRTITQLPSSHWPKPATKPKEPSCISPSPPWQRRSPPITPGPPPRPADAGKRFEPDPDVRQTIQDLFEQSCYTICLEKLPNTRPEQDYGTKFCHVFRVVTNGKLPSLTPCVLLMEEECPGQSRARQGYIFLLNTTISFKYPYRHHKQRETISTARVFISCEILMSTDSALLSSAVSSVTVFTTCIVTRKSNVGSTPYEPRNEETTHSYSNHFLERHTIVSPGLFTMKRPERDYPGTPLLWTTFCQLHKQSASRTQSTQLTHCVRPLPCDRYAQANNCLGGKSIPYAAKSMTKNTTPGAEPPSTRQTAQPQWPYN
ncbi:uncharacterized protein BCR38DRAFT_470133 [Pseudomassariella vexata]|uniref:Uncharacterized protein n=1 Tax=Pseudomassariella vexata TaxID=1141098 RepID=A0A1Y2EHQ1_9PEZI|nr:uncharacterized protein BCR38DRAFT_470133 [Pseudomassariella vexata]ORY71100.1 hypothetical protein BCR38DRAFT_470133 [Pseudomassariella vexata]